MVALATLALVGSFLYLGTLIAIATFLLFMLAGPIYLGWKRPRELAVAGLVALLIAAPIGAFLYSEQLRSPSAPVGSDPQNGGSVLTNAGVTPFSAAAGSDFSFHVTVNPQFLPAGAHAPEYVVLYLSSCPGATTGNASVCGGAGYAFWALNQTFNTTLVNSTLVTLHRTLNMSNLWYWMMAFVYQNVTNQSRWVWVDPMSAYGGVQGPVSGDLASTVTLLLPTFFEAMFLYVGIVFFAVLVIYMFFKSREARRNPPVSTGRTGGTGAAEPGSAPPSPTTAKNERSCPKCGAVVYPSETACWKCGAPLGAAPSSSSPPLS